MNKVILAGNISIKNPLNVTKKGVSVINISIATNEKYKDAEGNQKQHTDFHELTIFGKLAEIADKHIEIGATMGIEGHNSYGSYEKEGQTHRTATVIVEKMEFLSAKKNKNATPIEKPEKPAKPILGDKCPKCGKGQLVEKTGKNGKFLGCNTYPDCKFTA